MADCMVSGSSEIGPESVRIISASEKEKALNCRFEWLESGARGDRSGSAELKPPAAAMGRGRSTAFDRSPIANVVL